MKHTPLSRTHTSRLEGKGVAPSLAALWWRGMVLVLLLHLPGAWTAAKGQSLYIAEEPEEEIRAVWLTTLSGLDWPRRTASTPEAARCQQDELCVMLDSLKAIGINTVLFQVRTRGMVAYPSTMEPWDGVFSGKTGVAPPYDPTAFALQECRKRGMAFHAWVVAFPLGDNKVMKQLGNKALPSRRAELCRKAGNGSWFMDPGVPQTWSYLGQLCAEIVRRYDVDGIHLDYIRYPEATFRFDDGATWRRYGGGRDKAAWRRDNVTRAVRAIRDSIKAVKPWVQLSCATIGKYADLPRQSSLGWNARDAVSQDAKQWLADGLVEAIYPMIYYQGNNFYPFAADWVEATQRGTVVGGLGIYFLDKHYGDWPLSVVTGQLKFLREIGAGGQAFFRARFLLDNVKGLADYLSYSFYTTDALLPALSTSDTTAPPTPRVDRLRAEGKDILMWAPVADESGGVVTYNVYRLDSIDNQARLVCLERGMERTSYTYQPLVRGLRNATLLVTAADRSGNESAPCELAVTPPPEREEQTIIALPTSDSHWVCIRNSLGAPVATVRYAPQLDVSALAPGIYEVWTWEKRKTVRRLTVFRR